MKWFFPSWNGDFRIESKGDDKCVLVVEKATAAERVVLKKFAEHAIKKTWVSEREIATDDERRFAADERYYLSVSADVAGKVLLKLMKPKRSTLTVVKFKDGKVSTAYGTESAAIDGAMKSMAKGLVSDSDSKSGAVSSTPEAAVSVARPTPCCPECIPGSVERASEVLLSFLTPEQHDQWAKHRTILVVGGLSGHLYRIAHRSSPIAVAQKRIAWDMTADHVMHFHDWSVPPEEEVLASKLILEHAEPWLRNEATAFAGPLHDCYKNPFGDGSDGGADAGLTQAIGHIGFALRKR